MQMPEIKGNTNNRIACLILLSPFAHFSKKTKWKSFLILIYTGSFLYFIFFTGRRYFWLIVIKAIWTAVSMRHIRPNFRITHADQSRMQITNGYFLLHPLLPKFDELSRSVFVIQIHVAAPNNPVSPPPRNFFTFLDLKYK